MAVLYSVETWNRNRESEPSESFARKRDAQRVYHHLIREGHDLITLSRVQRCTCGCGGAHPDTIEELTRHEAQ